jgi:hypothetical protein
VRRKAPCIKTAVRAALSYGVLLLLLILPHAASSEQNVFQEEKRDPAKTRIKRVAYHSERLWVLGQFGTLLALDLKSNALKQVKPDPLIYEMYVAVNKEMYLLGGAGWKSQKINVWQKEGERWKRISSVERGGQEALIGLTEYDGRLLLLTAWNLHLQQPDGSWRKVHLNSTLSPEYQTPFAATANGFIYVGFNYGEFGGGLKRIVIETGRVERIEKEVKKKKDEICAGPLNTECDPITGVIRDPENPSCVLVSIGLRHLGTESGRLLRVCGNNVQVLSLKSDTFAPDASVESEEEGIFDLIPAKNGYWIVTGESIYRFVPGQKREQMKLPEKVREVAGVAINDEVPGVIIVATDINWAFSTSGYTPLIAVKD